MAERRSGRRRQARRHPARIDAACRTTASALAIGIGVNVVAHPDDVPYPATSLQALGLRLRRRDAVPGAVRRLEREHAASGTTGAGLTEIRQRWLSRAAGLGVEVAVRVDGNVVRGVFETIDEDCRFVIRDAAAVS